MNPAAAKRLRLLASAVSVLVVLALAAGGWFYSRVRASLPQLDGPVALAGLGAPVTIDRDALGVPTVRGATRVDVARALGWIHAQERFFQMDVLRRNSAGELAEVFGPRTLPLDRANRMHGFRARAQNVLAALPAADRALLEAYTAGVNAGLTALGARPFEYLVRRETPQPWRAEDCLLVAYTLTLDLQDETARYERTLMTLRDQFDAESLGFFAPLTGPDDAALDGSTAALPAIPGPRILDLRTQKTGATSHPLSPRERETVPGSNAFALGGAHTASGAGLLANDMHLDLRVPNTWFRASLEFGDRRITGVTLPGLPLVVAGSNGRVAWGFTASYADVVDLVVVETAPGLTSWYMVQGDSRKFEQRAETIRVKGGKAVTVDYTWTIWGPIVGKDERGRPLALRWVAHDPAATNLALREFEDAPDATAAVAIARRTGMPAVNAIIADAAGNIAWTIAGRLPKRVGYDGRLPVSWAFGDRRWEGLLPPEDVPAIQFAKEASSPETPAKAGRLWSANQRQLGGEALARIGDGGYARPYRAAQIRDGLATLERAGPRDLLAVQLDDRALFLTPWHKLLLDTLSPAALAEKKPRAALRGYAEKWEGRAQIDAVSYPIVKEFRLAVRARVFPILFAACLEANPDFDWESLNLEPALWALLREKPRHLLDPQYASWDDLLVAAADDVIGFLDKQAITLPQANWGRRNTSEIRHPFSYSLPGWLTGSLRMPAEPLPGDVDMPRVQTPTHGASERFVVSPGREQEGIFHMPGGQSGHPLSPFFRAGHEAWARGEPTPFLPGKTEHTLRLAP